MANRKVTKDVSDNIIAGAVLASFPLNKLDRILEAHAADHDKIVVKGSNLIPLRIGDNWFLIDTDTNVSTASDMDTGAVAAGTNYYVYACDNSGTLVFKMSLASTYPTGFTAATSRKLGGFQTLCANVGTIASHPLTGYLANDILPKSIWDLKHRPVSEPEGMTYDEAIGKWVDIYLISGTGVNTASVNGGTISDERNWMDFVDDVHAVKKRLATDHEFQSFAAGSNEGTNIDDSSDPVNTGGHSDTASRRMISNIGCEDCCGAMYQWLLDQSWKADAFAHTHTENTEASYTQNAETVSKESAPAFSWKDVTGGKGKLFTQGTYGDIKLLAGMAWDCGASGGSRGRSANYSRWHTYTAVGGRAVSERL